MPYISKFKEHKINKRKSLQIFFSVIKALFLREIVTRFSTKKLGYLWAIIDPMAMIVVFSIMKIMLGKKIASDIDYSVFLATSFIAYNMFKDIAFKSMEAFNANQGLFVYKQVRPIDTIISRSLIEVLIRGVITLLFLFIGWFLGLNIDCKNILGVLIGFIWIAFFGLSLGILFAVIGFFYENFKNIIKLVFLPMFFLSGLFYTAGSLPPMAREILLYNPILNFMELIHGNYFYSLDTHYVNYSYILFWTLIPMFIGLWIYNKSEKKIIMS